jgi:cytochrome P450
MEDSRSSTKALRIHPPTGFILERIVPSGGVRLCGQHTPEDTVIDVNAWVLHRNSAIFGHDADTFRPERWIDSRAKKIKEMKRSLIAVSITPCS